MSPRTASDLYSEMKNMSVEERIRFFSLSLAEMHRELQESIIVKVLAGLCCRRVDQFERDGADGNGASVQRVKRTVGADSGFLDDLQS